MVENQTKPSGVWGGLVAPPEMDDLQFQRWKELVEQRTGLVLPDNRRSFLITALNMRMRELECADFQTYFDIVRKGSSGLVEWSILVDRLTVHETRFFRHKHSVELLRESVLPQTIADMGDPLSLNVWSVGCATGEEPYTLAMVFDEFLSRTGRDYYFGITGSDISYASLSTARKGIYHERKLTEVAPALMRRYMRQYDDTHYEVKESLRRRVCFAQLNVLDMQRAPVGKVHLIFCQNMLIYFERDKRLEIVNNLSRYLEPGGLLILGSGEVLGWDHPDMRRIDDHDTLAFQYLPRKRAAVSAERGH